jgi:hypothetical protein
MSHLHGGDLVDPQGGLLRIGGVLPLHLTERGNGPFFMPPVPIFVLHFEVWRKASL